MIYFLMWNEVFQIPGLPYEIWNKMLQKYFVTTSLWDSCNNLSKWNIYTHIQFYYSLS